MSEFEIASKLKARKPFTVRKGGEQKHAYAGAKFFGIKIKMEKISDKTFGVLFVET